MLSILLDLESKLVSGDYQGAWDAFKRIGDMMFLETIASPSMLQKDDCHACCCRIEKLCHAMKASTTIGGGGCQAGPDLERPDRGPKWDGTILRIILEALPSIIALFK